jgi:hypothetical protein
MGNNVICCAKEPDNATNMRELYSLEDTEACRSWMEGTSLHKYRISERTSQDPRGLQQKTNILLPHRQAATNRKRGDDLHR